MNSDMTMELSALKGRTGLRKGNEGQTMALVPVVILLITVFFCIGFNVSWYARKRIAVQQAADSAALGAARVQGMMLEDIAAGNDAIAINIAQILKDLANMEEFWEAVPDLLKRIEWIKTIQNGQDVLGGDVGMFLPMAAAITSGMAAGADFAFACPPSSGSAFGVKLPTFSSHPQLDVERPLWTAFLFMTRKSSLPFVPAQFSIHEKPVVIAFSNLEKKLGLPIPLSPQSQGSFLVGTSASAPYFIPWGNPADRDTMDVGTAVICLMIPGPFWGARLDEVGRQTWTDIVEGEAAYLGLKLLSYGFGRLNGIWKQKLFSKVENALTTTVADENEIEMETFSDE
jgi:hypothetical protein